MEVDHEGAFRHALIREAVYDDTAWTRRRSYHRRLAAELARRGAPPETVAEQWLAGGVRDRARPSLLAAAERFCQVHAYRDAAHAVRRALSCGRTERTRTTAWPRWSAWVAARNCTVISPGPRKHGGGRGGLPRPGRPEHARRAPATPGRGLRAAGAWDRALAARVAAAEAFAEGGQEFEAATERLAAASHPQAAANLTSALELVASARSAVERIGSIELRARALSLEGQIRAKLGDAERGVELAREGLALALAGNLSEPAAEAYRLASASSTPPATPKRSTRTQPPPTSASSKVSRAWRRSASPASPVMVKTGEWDRAVEFCRAILDAATPQRSPDGGRSRTRDRVRPAR